MTFTRRWQDGNLIFSVSTISSIGNTFSTVKVSRWMRGSILTSHKQMMWQMSPEDTTWMNNDMYCKYRLFMTALNWQF